MKQRTKKEKKTMDWDSLKEHRCPKIGCGRRLMEKMNRGDVFYGRECFGCGFFITNKRFDEIIGELDNRE